ncbi:MAG: alpha/beta hydrolase [Bacteroidia bacterium]
MKIYLISGLGADARVFEKLNFKEYDTELIHWSIPAKEESLESYVEKLLDQIEEKEGITLLGVSFGGIIAQEMGRKINCQRIILVSSIVTPKEFSFPVKILRRVRIDKLFGGVFLRKAGEWFAPYFFSVKEKQEKKMLKEIVRETDIRFLRWAINKIMEWQELGNSAEILRIHGNKDRIFPGKRIEGAVVINNGGHFMIYNRANEIVKIIEDVVN